jgi:hypothetical protein
MTIALALMTAITVRYECFATTFAFSWCWWQGTSMLAHARTKSLFFMASVALKLIAAPGASLNHLLLAYRSAVEAANRAVAHFRRALTVEFLAAKDTLAFVQRNTTINLCGTKSTACCASQLAFTAVLLAAVSTSR